MLLAGQQAESQEQWTSAYTDEQLDAVEKLLKKWKPEHHYTKVKDAFKWRHYQPSRTVLENDPPLWEVPPASFANEREARRAGGICDFIKDASRKSCLLRLVGSQGAWLFVYDQDAAGRYVKTSLITIPTWYDSADVTLVDVFGTGKSKFILIEHQGDHGTGIDEKIHWLLGWRDGAFRTVFREMVFSRVSCLGEYTIYRMNYRIGRGKSPRIDADCCFDQVFDTAYPYDFHAHWKDWLFWDAKDFSFYNGRIEKEKTQLGQESDASLTIRQKVQLSRARVRRLPPLPEKMWEDEAVTEYWKGIGYKEVQDKPPTNSKPNESDKRD